ADGEILGLIGPNGAGKSTVFNVLSGLYRPDAGRVTFDGGSLLDLTPHAIACRGIARTFQNTEVFRPLSVLDNVLVGLHSRLRGGLLGAAVWSRAVAREERAARERRGQAARGRERRGRHRGISGNRGRRVTVLDVEDLSVAYGQRRALEGVSLSVREGEIVTLLGANGSGKSTTLRAISGLVPPQRGRIRYRG